MGKTLYLALFNLILIIGGIYLGSHARVKTFLKERSRRIMEKRETVRTDLEKAKKDHVGLRERMAHVREDIDRTMEAAEITGEQEGKKILIDAEVAADRIIQRSMQRADFEVKKRDRIFYEKLVDRYVEGLQSEIRARMKLKDQIKWGRAVLEKIADEVKTTDGI